MFSMGKASVHKIISYIRAGILLHLVTLIEIVTFFFLFRGFYINLWLYSSHWLLKFFTPLALILMPAFAQFDARSRFQNYKLVKDQLYLYGFQPRIIKPFVKSRCQRDAAIAAARELGMGDQCKYFFKSNGYSWYHFFPDVIFSRPKVLLTKNFWVTTLFVKTYQPKINFDELKRTKQKAKKPSFQMASDIVSGV